MSRLVEGRFVNVSKVRREMRHIKRASHGCIDDGVFAGTMPLRDQPDLLNSLRPGLRPQNRFYCGIDCHGLAETSIDELPGSVVSDVRRNPVQRVFDELLVDLAATRATAQPTRDDNGGGASSKRIYDNPSSRRRGFDEKLSQPLRHRSGMCYAAMLIVGLRDAHDISGIGAAHR